MLCTPRDSGVNSLPLYTRRGHSHLGSMGCTMVFYWALSLSAYCPYAWAQKKKPRLPSQRVRENFWAKSAQPDMWMSPRSFWTGERGVDYRTPNNNMLFHVPRVPCATWMIWLIYLMSTKKKMSECIHPSDLNPSMSQTVLLGACLKFWVIVVMNQSLHTNQGPQRAVK